MEADEETLLRKLQEVAAGPGGATAGNVDSGELFGLAGLFSFDLRAAFDRVSCQLAVLDGTAGLDSISVLTSPKVAESFFRLVEKLVSCEIASADVFNKFSDIAKTATTGKKKGYAALWSSLYRDRLFWAEKDYADADDGHGARVEGVPNLHDVGGVPAALVHGVHLFVRERDVIAGFMCNYIFSRCDPPFQTRIKDLFKKSGLDAAKQLGKFNDYCGLRSAIIHCLPGMPPALLLPILKFAAASVRGRVATTAQETHVDRMLAASRRSTETMVSVGKRLVAALVQSPVADLDTAEFASLSFSGADLLKLAPMFGVSFLRGSLVTDAFVLSAQMHANKPLVINGDVGGRSVRVLNPAVIEWDQTTHMAVGKIVHQQIASLSTGTFGKRVNDALLPESTSAVEPKQRAVGAAGKKQQQSTQQSSQQPIRLGSVGSSGGSGGGAAVVDAINASINVGPVFAGRSKRKADGAVKHPITPRSSAVSLAQEPRAVVPAARQQPPAAVQVVGDTAAAGVFQGVCYRCGSGGHIARKCNNAPIVPACGACKMFHPPDKDCWRPTPPLASSTPRPVPGKRVFRGGGAGKGGR